MSSTRLVRNRIYNCDSQKASNYILEQPYINPAISNDPTIIQQWSSLLVGGIDIDSSLKGIDQNVKRDKRQVIITPFCKLKNSPLEVYPTLVPNDTFVKPCLIKHSRSFIKDVKPDSLYLYKNYAISEVPPNINSRWLDR